MKWLYELLGPTVSRGVADEARATGDYARLEARARHKRDVLSAHGLLEPTLADGGLSAAELLAWYRERGRRADIAGAHRGFR